MKQEYWLKYGFKENGELICVRMLSNSEPEKNFFYTEAGEARAVKRTNVLKITPQALEKINNTNYKWDDEE